jgi:hypothetical protein
VGVEKVRVPPKQPKFGGYKMSRKPRKSLVGHPDAILFSRIPPEGVFQQPLSIALIEGSMSVNADFDSYGFQ